jgi:hypothetical protein
MRREGEGTAKVYYSRPWVAGLFVVVFRVMNTVYS